MSSALRGHLDLVCTRDDAGRTALARQSFAAPMHLSKPYWDGRHLVINAVNPTAGLFSGDEVEITVRVESGASTLFTSPSASRVHRARDGEPAALVRQTFSVARGGWLEVCPEMLIAQTGARYEQHTRLEVEPGGGLLSFDSLAPGRVASGEVFAFEHVRAFTRLLIDGDLVAAETCRLTPADDSLTTLRIHHAHSYHATWFAVFPADIPTDLRTAFHAGPELLIGASPLGRHAFVGKILAADSVALRRGIDAVRTICYAALGRPRPAWRKL